MARPKKDTAAKQDTQKVPEKVETKTSEKEKEAAKQDTQKVPDEVDKLMKLYPQYEEIYVTPQGFVHTKDAAEYMLKGAVLYKNKYYKQ